MSSNKPLFIIIVYSLSTEAFMTKLGMIRHPFINIQLFHTNFSEVVYKLYRVNNNNNNNNKRACHLDRCNNKFTITRLDYFVFLFTSFFVINQLVSQMLNTMFTQKYLHTRNMLELHRTHIINSLSP